MPTMVAASACSKASPVVAHLLPATNGWRYTQTYAYDVLDRLTTGPKGSGYTYGDTNHLDALTTAPSYTASYDAAGDMTGRSGQVLGYNALPELSTWQNQATQVASYSDNGNGTANITLAYPITRALVASPNDLKREVKRVIAHYNLRQLHTGDRHSYFPRTLTTG